MRLTVAALFVVALLSAGVSGQTRRPDLQPLPEPPPPPPGVLEAEPEPQTVVRRKDGGDTIDEYRVGGRVVMIRVIPARGVPYVLTDPRGDGSFSNRRDSLEYPPGVPMWLLFSF